MLKKIYEYNWPIKPFNLVSAWLAIDKADKENGCLKLIPGSHTTGLIDFSQHGVHREMDTSTLDFSKEVEVEVEKGDCVLFHSLLAHGSSENNSSRSRNAIIPSYMSADSVRTSDEKIKYIQICGKSFENCV